MEITAIKKDKNHTVRLDFQDGSSVKLDADYANELCLHVGDSITAERLSEYSKESEYVRAKSRGMWFLDRADHSEKSLYEKIVKGGISPTAAARAVARFKELGLLDDRRYAQLLAEQMSENNISKREAYAKLLQKGIPNSIIKSVLEETDFDEAAQIKAVIEKKYRTKLSDRNDIQKVYAALIRKGFSYSAVREQLKKYIQETENYEEY